MKKCLCRMVAFCSAVVPTIAFAALSTDQQAVVTAVEGNITDWTAAAWTLVLAILGATVGIKIAKKFIKASV